MGNRQPPRRARFVRLAALTTVASLLAASSAVAAEGEGAVGPAAAASTKPYVAPASDEGASAMKQFNLLKGWKVDLFAAEPRVANPVSFSIDDQGKVYVVETFRRRSAVLDMRTLPDWVDDDLASRTVADRVAMVKKRMPDSWQSLAGPTDRVRVIEDSDGDGVADRDTVFADGFDKLEDGTAAGVLPWGDSVYFTSIPNLWLLKDTDGNRHADVRKSLAYGFGVRYNFSGHDLHGLRMGPDGRLYFSIADRGLHVTDKDGKTIIDNPDSGAVMRCEPDGSRLELVHTGLRNPQELAFDELGNLFTGDNNSDGGDPTRWVHVVEGGESGWHVGWQWVTGFTPRGPWLSEGLCLVDPPVPAFYRLPPIANPKIAGPAGLTYAPGTGLPPEWAGRFFLVDFRGGAAGGSGIYSLKNKPKGATFELEEQKDFVTGVLPTDVEFGPDGRIYFTDWVTGWEPKGKGRIYALTPPGGAADKAVAEVKKLLAQGFDKRPDAELAALLSHADVRVRMRAQFALAARGDQGVATLTTAAAGKDNLLARLHAVWGLGQVARKTPGESPAAKAVLPLLADGDAEVCAQAASVLGDAHDPAAVEGLAKLLTDKNARVRFFAGQSLGKIKPASADVAKAAADKVLAMLRKNRDADAYVRHAGVMALLGLNDSAVLESASADDSAAVRMAALLVYRRQHSPAIQRFLADVDPNLVLEAARAIAETPINDALPALAALSSKTGLTEPALNRALSANYRLGTPAAAKAVAAFATRADVPNVPRVEAVKMLAEWAKPAGRDKITGLWRPVPPRDDVPAKQALAAALDGLLKSAPDPVRIAALNASVALGVNTVPLFDLATDEKNPPALRAAAVGAMAEQKDAKLPEAAKLAAKSKDEPVRVAAVRVAPYLDDGLKALAGVLKAGTPREQQAVFQTVAALTTKDKAVVKAGDDLLTAGLDKLEKGTLPVEAQLDLLEAAAKKKTGKLATRAKAYDAARAKKLTADPLATNRETLAGGDADRGGYVFRERADVSCMRCHAVKGVGGNAGPDLAGVLARGGNGPAGREHILESILYPSKKVAQGFETVALRTNDGDVIAGVFKGEDDKTITLDVPNQGQVKVEKANVKKRDGGMSAMPDDIAKTLSKQDLRDLVEFLAGQ